MTRGFGEEEAREAARCIADVLEAPADESRIARIAARVQDLCAAHPVYRGS
jgi:glycine hydroxymethyltransferase